MSKDLCEGLRGKFIVLDGVDGAGKGEQRDRLTRWLADHGVDVFQTRDPGGTEIGDRIRHVLLDYDLARMDVRCEALLFMASRAQLLAEEIRPRLSEGRACVVCDRFVSATCAYQGAAGFDPRRVIELAKFAVEDCWPHLTIVLDVAPEEGFDRTGHREAPRRKRADVHGQIRLLHDAHADAMESRPLSFHRRVRELFLELPTFYPAPIAIVDGAGSKDDVQRRVMGALEHEFL